MCTVAIAALRLTLAYLAASAVTGVMVGALRRAGSKYSKA